MVGVGGEWVNGVWVDWQIGKWIRVDAIDEMESGLGGVR